MTMTRFRWGYSVMFVIWVATAIISVGPTLAASAALTPAAGADPSGGLVLEAIVAAGGTNRAAGVAMFFALLSLAVASPGLSVAWLSALARPASLSQSLASGARRYFPAVRATLFLVPLLLIAVGVMGGLSWGADQFLEDASAPTHDVGVLLATLPGLLLMAVWATWHDLARVRIAESSEGGFRAVTGALRHLGVGTVARYTAFFVVAGLISVVGVAVTGGVGSSLAVIAGQLFILARLTVRGLYLSSLVAAAS
jgi:hypothetical protein